MQSCAFYSQVPPQVKWGWVGGVPVIVDLGVRKEVWLEDKETILLCFAGF